MPGLGKVAHLRTSHRGEAGERGGGGCPGVGGFNASAKNIDLDQPVQSEQTDLGRNLCYCCCCCC